MILTKNQLSIIYSEEDKIKVNALAGTGKTTVLEEYAKENFNENILYLVYTKDMKKSTRDRMPCNTEVYTFNSFVYSLIGKEYNIIDLNIFNISKLLNVNNIMYINLLIQNYKPVEDDPIYQEMIKQKTFEHLGLMRYFLDTFDFSKLNFDTLFIDEAQDVNPIMFELIEKLNIKKHIIVGDKNQNIFGFMNTISILDKLDYPEFVLNETFRFGEEIANYVNTFFKDRCNRDIDIIPNKSIDSQILKLSNDFVGIFRTNARLLEEAFKLSSNYKVSIPLDMNEIKELIESILYLSLGIYGKISSHIVKKYKSIEEMKEIMKRGIDKELYPFVKLVETHGITLFDKVRGLERSLSHPRYADIILVTAHKAKGLQFKNVKVYDDFSIKTVEEQNILYVALTRAVENLDISLV